MPEKDIKVLIVDDNQVVLDVTSAGLETEGFEVITALDGKHGLESAFKNLPDLILLDLKLPDIDGFAVCKEVRNNPDTASIPIIMVTGDMTVDIDKAFSAGADDCIIKPIDLGYLSARIRKLVKKKNKIMFIDDDRQIGEMVSAVVKKQQYDIEVRYDGRNLMEALKREKPDLLLLDVSLPVGPDGVEICRLVKSDPDTRSIPVVMITANEFVDSIEKCFSYGAEDYIFKPFNVPDLLLKIKKYVHFANKSR